VRDDSLERLHSLLLFARVKHVGVELEVGVGLVLSSLEHITFTLVTLVGITRCEHAMAATNLSLSLHVTLFGRASMLLTSLRSRDLTEGC